MRRGLIQINDRRGGGIENYSQYQKARMNCNYRNREWTPPK